MVTKRQKQIKTWINVAGIMVIIGSHLNILMTNELPYLQAHAWVNLITGVVLAYVNFVFARE